VNARSVRPEPRRIGEGRPVGRTAPRAVVSVPRPERVRPRLRVVASILVTFAVLLAAAGLQVVLIGNQRHLDQVNADIRVARERQYSLRREETLLRSPQDVAEIATKELGMVPPERAVLVSPDPVVIGGQRPVEEGLVAPATAPAVTPGDATP